MIAIGEAKWQLIAERKLNLIGTKIIVTYGQEPGDMLPYHVHRETACHFQTNSLEEAKAYALVVVGELTEMGVDP